jgi:hypothetical protein
MSAYGAFSDYMALRSHFTTSYDYFKYEGKLKNNTVRAYEHRKDQFWFEKLGRKKDYRGFLISNLVAWQKLPWIGELLKEQKYEDTHVAWRKRIQSLGYVFKDELKNLHPTLIKNFETVPEVNPTLIDAYLKGHINIETICILLSLIPGSKKYFDKKYEDDDEWRATSFLIEKYTPFIKCDYNKMRAIAYDYFQSSVFKNSKEKETA